MRTRALLTPAYAAALTDPRVEPLREAVVRLDAAAQSLGAEAEASHREVARLLEQVRDARLRAEHAESKIESAENLRDFYKRESDASKAQVTKTADSWQECVRALSAKEREVEDLLRYATTREMTLDRAKKVVEKARPLYEEIESLGVHVGVYTAFQNALDAYDAGFPSAVAVGSDD